MLSRIPHDSQAITGELKTDAYVQNHEKYAHVQYKPFMRELARQIKNRRLSPNGRFLEIGSGPGFLTAIIAEQYPQAEINAIELSPDMITTAKKVVGRSQPECRVRFIEGSPEDSTKMIHLGKFDFVYSTFSLHHWENPVQVIKAMYQALKVGGLMLIFDFKRVFWLYLLPTRNGFIDSIRAAYRSNEISRLLSQAQINRFNVRTFFPYFWHTLSIAK